MCDPTRGTKDDRLVESIDLIPTFMELAGCEELPDHWLEGRSLAPMLRGQAVTEWRDAVFSECDYAIRHARNTLSKGPEECRVFMIRTEDWKFILYESFPPAALRYEKRSGRTRRLRRGPVSRRDAASVVRSDIRVDAQTKISHGAQQQRDRQPDGESQGTWLSLRRLVKQRKACQMFKDLRGLEFTASSQEAVDAFDATIDEFRVRPRCGGASQARK